MNARSKLASFLLTGSCATAAYAQGLESLRIEGPAEVVENAQAVFVVFALFDNGLEYDVTLFSSLSLAPGDHAAIDPFGIFSAFEVSEDATEVLSAKFTFGDQTRQASQSVSIRDIGPARHGLLFDADLDRVHVEADLLNHLPLTLEAWVRLDSLWTDHMTVISNNRPFYWGHGIQIDRSGHLGVMAHDFQEYSNAALTVGAWHHVAVVYDVGVYRLYLDAQEVKTRSYSQRELDARPYFWIGKNTADDGNTRERDFPGMIDEVRVWHLALEADDLLCAMTKRLDGDEGGLVAYYRFDDAAGQHAVDATPFGRDGFLGGNDNPDGDRADPTWAISLAPLTNDTPDECGFDSCEAMVRLKVRCVDFKLIAKLQTLLPPGAELTLDNEGKRRQVVIDERGRGKATWREQFGLHTVYVVGCEDFVDAANCGP